MNKKCPQEALAFENLVPRWYGKVIDPYWRKQVPQGRHLMEQFTQLLDYMAVPHVQLVHALGFVSVDGWERGLSASCSSRRASPAVMASPLGAAETINSSLDKPHRALVFYHSGCEVNNTGLGRTKRIRPRSEHGHLTHTKCTLVTFSDMI